MRNVSAVFCLNMLTGFKSNSVRTGFPRNFATVLSSPQRIFKIAYLHCSTSPFEEKNNVNYITMTEGYKLYERIAC